MQKNLSRSHETTEMIVLKKSPEDGICNLCLNKFDSLSEDHVPPRCTGNNGSGKYRSCFPQLQLIIAEETYSDGITYKTICHECNCKLGKYYDK
jgi:hypothetical protein